MSTADCSGGSDHPRDLMKFPQLEQLRGAHPGALTRRETSIQQAGGLLEDIQATFELIISRNKTQTKLNSLFQQLNKTDYHLETDVKDASDVFMAAEKAGVWCQGKMKKLQPPSPSDAAAQSSGSLTTKLRKLNLPSFSREYTQCVSF